MNNEEESIKKYLLEISDDAIVLKPQNGGRARIIKRDPKNKDIICKLTLKGKAMTFKESGNDGHIKKVVTGVFIYWILFIIVTYITFWVKGSIPDTLVQVGLGGGTFELICTTVIEVAKKVIEDKEKKYG